MYFIALLWQLFHRYFLTRERLISFAQTNFVTKVSMLGHDLQLDAGVGICGKEGQSVPVGVGQPTLKIDKKIDNKTVGGTQ